MTTSPGRLFDVFISYRRPDRALVSRWLLPLLKRHRFRVFVDFDQVTGGLPTSEYLRRAQEQSRWTIAVLTAKYPKSPFTEFELRQALMTRRLVAVLMGRCRVPPGIAPDDIVDLTTSGRRRTGSRALVQRLRRDRPADRAPRITVRPALDRAVERHWTAFRSALAERRVQQGFDLLYRRLFRDLHYTFGSYIDSADALQTLRWQTAGQRMARPAPPLGLPLTGTFVRSDFMAGDIPEAWIETALGVTLRALWAAGDAEACFRRARALYRRQRFAEGAIVNTINLADVLWEQHRFAELQRELQGALRAARRLQASHLEAVVLQDLSLRLACSARWDASRLHLRQARQLAKGDRHRQAIINAHTARRALLLVRWLRAAGTPNASLQRRHAKRALVAARLARASKAPEPVDRHAVRALWLQGAALSQLDRYPEALAFLERARDLCGSISLSELEGDICLDLARTHLNTGNVHAATSVTLWALNSARRSGRQLQVIDSRVLLGAIALSAGRRTQAVRALRSVMARIRRSGRGPRYEVALREARRLLSLAASLRR